MPNHNQFRSQSRKAALCGILAALSVVILTMGGLIPFATFACPMLALICQPPVVCEYGTKISLVLYAAVSILALLLCTDKEIAMFYTFIGWYPSLRPRLERIPQFLGVVIKCGLFSLSMAAMYLLLLYLFRLEEIVAEFSEYSTGMLVVLLVLGNVSFLLFDRVLSRVSVLYYRKRKKPQQ